MKVFYRPVKPFWINQSFGENKACVSTDGKNKFITCDGNNPPKGFKSVYGSKGHLGVDLHTLHGQEVYCSQKGIVVGIDTDPKSGLDVTIESQIDNRIFRHTYEHLMGYQVKMGQEIQTGQLIGWADNTGWSSGDHLHWEVHELIKGKWVPIDPIPLTEPAFAKDILWINNKILFIKEELAKLLDNMAFKMRN